MARKKREVSETGIYHVLLRGVNSLFLTDKDFEMFLSLLKQKSNGATIIAYVLLKNRIHIIIDTKGRDIGLVIKPIGTSYARYCNRTRATSGKLFYDRFKSEALSFAELADAVAFLNFIARSQNSGFSSLDVPLCKPSECGLTENQAKSTECKTLFIEDYDCLSKAELANYIHAVLGVYPKDFKSQSPERQRELMETLVVKSRFSKSKLYDILNVKKPQSVKKIELPSTPSDIPVPDKPKKRDLSVWLL